VREISGNAGQEAESHATSMTLLWRHITSAKNNYLQCRPYTVQGTYEETP